MNSPMDALVLDIYEAAIEPAKFAPLLDRLGALLGADVAVQRTGFGPGDFSVFSSEQDPIAVSEYMNHFCQVDPWIANIHKIETAGVISCGALLPYDDFVRTEFYNDFFKRQPLHWGLAAVIDPSPATASYVTVMRKRRFNDFDSSQYKTMESLMPHLQAAAQIQRRLAPAVGMNRTLEQALNRLGHGVLVLSIDGAVIHMNLAANTLLAESTVLQLKKGRLQASEPATDKRLQGMVARTCAPGRAPINRESCALHLGPPSARQALDLIICPYMPNEPLSVRGDAAAIVFLHATHHRTSQTDTFLRQRYGLTTAEIRCAIALAAGESVQEIAERLAVSPLTVRAQVRALHTKVQVKRQGALIAKLNRDLVLLELLSDAESDVNLREQ